MSAVGSFFTATPIYFQKPVSPDWLFSVVKSTQKLHLNRFGLNFILYPNLKFRHHFFLPGAENIFSPGIINCKKKVLNFQIFDFSNEKF